MIFPFIGDATNQLQVDAHVEDSDNKIVAMVDGGCNCCCCFSWDEQSQQSPWHKWYRQQWQ